VLSNFTVKYGDGTLVRVPVMYGDQDRQAASIVRQNSENAVSSVPRISVYVSSLDIDHQRLGDSTYTGKVHIRERDVIDGGYTQGQGKNYTVERMMPTPFKLTLKCDIWSSNTDQKLQLLEQILVLFNPSLELQTTDNYIDWTSLSVLNLTSINWSSRQVPVGIESPIDVATLNFDTPIWISPPVKVKHLGVITSIITSIHEGSTTDPNNYIEGLGQPLAGPNTTLGSVLSRDTVTISDYNIEVYNNQAILLGANESVVPIGATLEIPVRQGIPILWSNAFDQYPGRYNAGSSTLFLTQSNGTQIVGTFAINPLDPTLIQITWDRDTLNTNTNIDSLGRIQGLTVEYDGANSFRPASPGTFDAIINPLTYNPLRPANETSDQTVAAGTRFLLVEDIGNIDNIDGADAWKNTDGSDFVAQANDIIEWQSDGTSGEWRVIFNAVQNTDMIVYQTNIYTGVQYIWNGVQWAKSFEGVYKTGQWRIEL
jgi:hypothetical protein